MSRKIVAFITAIVMSLTLVSCGIFGPQAPKEISHEGTVSESVIYDSNNVVIKATGIEYGNWKANVELEITNNGNQELSITSGTMGYSSNSVSGYMVKSGYLNEDVGAKSTIKTEIGFDYVELQSLGIDRIANVCLGFTIHGDRYEYTDPLVIKTSLDGNYDYNSDKFKAAMDSGVLEYMGDGKLKMQKKSHDILWDNGGVRLEAFGYYLEEGKDGTEEAIPELVYEINNTTDTHVGVRVSDIKVNGIMIEEGLWDGELINPNCRNATTLRLEYLMDRDEWKDAGIEEIENISFTLGLRDRDGNTLGKESEVTFNVK